MKNKENINDRLYRYIRSFLLYFGFENFPDFLIIGAQKAGTVTLSRYLEKHHKIISARREIGFFSSNNYHKGYGWYKKHLPIRFNKNKLIFEKTPEYLYYPESAKRIHKFNSDIKLIMILRNPVNRAFSGWNHYRKYYYNDNNYRKSDLLDMIREHLGKEKGKDFIEFLNRPQYPSFKESILDEISCIQNGIFRYEPSFVRRGIYYEQIQNFLKFFPMDQLLIIESQELRTKPKETLNQVTSFIGIEPLKLKKTSLKTEHISNYKGSRIDDESKAILYDFYRPHNKKLFKLIKKEFDWDEQ